MANPDTTPTILICDDEEHVRAILKRRFESDGWRVLAVTNGAEAIAVAKAERPSAIIMDFQMPLKTGVEAAVELYDDTKTRSIPIVMLTGRSHKITSSTMGSTSIRSVISKPFSASEVVSTAADLAGRPNAPAAAPRAESCEFEADNSSVIDEAYESLSLIYRLCGAMSVHHDPVQICQAALSGLSDATGFRGVAAVLSPSAKPLGPDQNQVFVKGTDTVTKNVESHTATEWLELFEGVAGGIVPSPFEIDTDETGREVVVSRIAVDDTECGMVVAFGGRRDWAAARGSASSFDTQIQDAVTRLISASFENAYLYRKQERLYVGTLTTLGAALEAKDPYTRGHSERVALLAEQLATAAGCEPGLVTRIGLAGRLHDIGKIGIRDSVLFKPDRLTDDEFEQIKQHPVIGYDMLKSITALEDILPAVRNHHERWDGKGYPDGLAGEDIDLSARILALADTFDAMSSNRSYRSQRSRDIVLDVIKENAGSQFDPALAKLFVGADFSLFDEVKAMHEAGSLGNQQAA
ncbi:MAG: HD domain-containing phosphohydrolase [Planctomycetota bacterium]